MKKYLIIAILLAILIIFGLIIFKKEIFFQILKKREHHALVSSLPFERKKQNSKHQLLIANLKPYQVYLENIIITPKNIPRGFYISLSLVLEFEDKKLAQKFREKKAFLKNIIVENSSEWDYLDFKSMDGLTIIKGDLLRSFKKTFGSKIKRVYLVEYQIHQHKRL